MQNSNDARKPYSEIPHVSPGVAPKEAQKSAEGGLASTHVVAGMRRRRCAARCAWHSSRFGCEFATPPSANWEREGLGPAPPMPKPAGSEQKYVANCIEHARNKERKKDMTASAPDQLHGHSDGQGRRRWTLSFAGARQLVTTPAT